MVESVRDEGEKLEGRGEPAEPAGDASSGGRADGSGVGAEEGPVGPAAWAADGEQANADPVLTETAGDLYARQGLHERAAEVYARLLEERPDDTDLQAKYERAREAVARRTGHEAVGEREMPADSAGEAAADGGDLEEVESAWTGGAGALAAERTPYAWEEEPTATTAEGSEGAGAVASRSVGEYFRKLLSWRPLSPDSAPAEPEPAERDSAGPGPIWPAASPDLGWDIVERVTTRSSGEESPGEGELGELFVVSKDAEPGSGRDAAEGGAAGREEEAEPRRESPWDRAASRGRGSGAIERLVSDPPPEVERSPEVLGRTRAEEEDDDDLEMFRAWLHSLKR